MSWQSWATRALAGMTAEWEGACGISRAAIIDARAALRQVEVTGHEPYFTLKAFVHLHGLDQRGDA